MRRFNPAWFDPYSNWLEYSVKKEAAFCLCCYLFRDSNGIGGKNDAWTTEGFSNWNKCIRISEHVGHVNSFHNNAVMKCENLMKQKQSIEHALHKQIDIAKNEYRIRLNASIDVSRYLLRQGLPFRGHDESETSSNRGNFVELLKYTTEQNEVVSKVVLENAPGNNQMVSSKIQKDIVHCFVEEIIKSIVEEIGHDVYGLLVDESADVSAKEQMAVVFRENTSAYYVHCFAHQLQLVVVGVAKKNFEVGEFFDMIYVLLNVVGASCKRKEMIREDHKKVMDEGIKNGEINTGTGLNQEVSFQRPRNTRWGSHYRTLFRLVELFSSIIKVFRHIQNESIKYSKRWQAYGLLRYCSNFDFVFYLQMMIHLLGLTNDLSMSLQRRDQDILNAMSLVKSTKRQLQNFRDDGWHSLMTKISSFCKKYDIEMVDMEEDFVDSKRPRKKTGVQNMHHYKVNCLYAVLDLELQEFNDRFTEVNTELLICVASLSPINSFYEFEHTKLMKLATFYPDDFSCTECISLEQQLTIYIDNVRSDERFSHLKSLGDLARMLVDTRKHLSYPLVYRLLKLVLILPVATATVERCFSALKIVKTDRRNQIGDQFLNDCLVCFIEKDVFETVTNETTMKRFQDMKDRRMIL